MNAPSEQAFYFSPREPITVHIVLRTGEWMDADKRVEQRTVVLGAYTKLADAEKVMAQARTRGWIGVTEAWIEERVLDTVGPEHDAKCELSGAPFCRCWIRNEAITFAPKDGKVN